MLRLKEKQLCTTFFSMLQLLIVAQSLSEDIFKVYHLRMEQLASALCSGSYSDSYADFGESQGSSVEATFSSVGWLDSFKGFGKSRLDPMFLNTHALRAAAPASIFRGPLAPGHYPLSVSFNIDVFQTKCWTVRPVAKWNLPAKPVSEQAWDERNQQCLPILHEYLTHPCANFCYRMGGPMSTLGTHFCNKRNHFVTKFSL